MSGLYSPPGSGGSIPTFSPGRILYADAAGFLTSDANFVRNPTTGALTLKDTSGTEQFTASQYATQAVGIFRGSSGAGVTTPGPIVKVTKYENLNSAAMGGNPADSAANANHVSIVTGALTNFPQSTAYYGLAQGGGTTAGSDICAIAGVGILANATSTSWGMGAYFEGRSAVSGGRWYGAEISPNNQTGVDSGAGATALLNNACNPGTGIWVPARGPNLNAVGVQVGAVNGSPGYRVGFMVNAASAAEASFREDSSATVGMDVRGTHTYGIDLHLATLSAAGVMLPNNKGVAAKNTGGGDVGILSLGGNNHVQLGASGSPIDALGLILPGKGVTYPNMGANAAADSGINFLDTGGTTISYATLQSDNSLHVGPSTAPATNGQVIFYGAGLSAGAAGIEAFRVNPGGGVKFANTALGLFNTTPTTKQTVSGAKGSNAALASLMTALATYGLVTDSTTA